VHRWTPHAGETDQPRLIPQQRSLARRPIAPSRQMEGPLDALDDLRLPRAIATSSARHTVEHHLTAHTSRDASMRLSDMGSTDLGVGSLPMNVRVERMVQPTLLSTFCCSSPSKHSALGRGQGGSGPKEPRLVSRVSAVRLECWPRLSDETCLCVTLNRPSALEPPDSRRRRERQTLGP
jgi:hypothetical protein